MNGLTTVNYNDNGQTEHGSLVTGGLSSGPVTGIGAMGLVSDSGETMDKPVTSWIFSIITACGLLIFLFVSFYQYHKRMREKRIREREYMKQFKEILPDCNYNDFKVTRARSVMTNTHFNTFQDKDSVEFKLGPPMGRRLFRTVPKLPPVFPERNEHVEVHKWPKGYGEDLDFPYIDDNHSEHHFIDKSDGEQNGELGYVHNENKVAEINKGKRKKIPEYKVKFKQKKKRKFLRTISSQKETFGQFVYNEAYQSPYLSDLYLYTRGNYEGRENIELQRQTRSDSDIYAFRAEELNNDESKNNLLNDYYIEAGIPKPATASKKRRQSTVSTASSADSKKRNALYDRLTLRDDQNVFDSELVHRDAKGLINLDARSLPMLDSEHYELYLKKLPTNTNESHSNTPYNTELSASSSNQSRRSSEPLLYSKTLQTFDETNTQMEERL